MKARQGSKNSFTTFLVPVLLALTLVISAFSACAGSAGKDTFDKLVGTPTDYSKAESWMLRPEQIEYAVDIIFLYPSAYIDPQGADFGAIEDEATRSNAQMAYTQMGSAFEGVGNVFVPYYQQFNVAKLAGLTQEELDVSSLQVPRTDVYAMLDYYFANLNEGRPFILAGHSQGSMMVRVVLDEYMEQHPEYYARMVCAYMLGMSLTQSLLDSNPHLKAAQGETDTGVIISWNTEGPGNADAGETCVVRAGAIAINPLNWETDDTYAGVSENKGSLVQAAGGNWVVGEGIADAQLNLDRGTVVCANIDPAPYQMPGAEVIAGPAGFHGQDYSFYYMNIRENAAKRVAAFLGTK